MRGEVSARARAAELGRTYLALDGTGRRNFLTILMLGLFYVWKKGALEWE